MFDDNVFANIKSLFFFICLCFNMISFRGQKKLGPRPDRSLLGVWAPGLIQNFRRASVPPSYAEHPPPPRAPPLALRFSPIGGSEMLVTREGQVFKYKGPWEGDKARIPKGKGNGKFERPSRSWAPKFLYPLSTPATKAKSRKGMTKSLFIKGRYDAPVTRLAMFGS